MSRPSNYGLRHFCVAGIDVNAAPLKRSPSTATVPVVTVKSADPRFPAIPARPGRLLSTTAILLFAGSGTFDVPSIDPLASFTVIATVVAAALGFTIATDVVKFGRPR